MDPFTGGILGAIGAKVGGALIGAVAKDVCPYCKGIKWTGETPGTSMKCCNQFVCEKCAKSRGVPSPCTFCK